MSSNFTVVYDACVLYPAAAGQDQSPTGGSRMAVDEDKPVMGGDTEEGSAGVTATARPS